MFPSGSVRKSWYEYPICAVLSIAIDLLFVELTESPLYYAKSFIIQMILFQNLQYFDQYTVKVREFRIATMWCGQAEHTLKWLILLHFFFAWWKNRSSGQSQSASLSSASYQAIHLPAFNDQTLWCGEMFHFSQLQPRDLKWVVSSHHLVPFNLYHNTSYSVCQQSSVCTALSQRGSGYRPQWYSA